MRPSRMVGEIELREAHCRVGMIISNCAMLEAAIAYLEWQLFAFSWDKSYPTASPLERQSALAAKRDEWNRYSSLEQRLAAASKAFDVSAVSVRANREPRVRELRIKWNKLREEARKLAEKRNKIGHTQLGWSNGHVVRTVGRPWQESVAVIAEEDEALRSDIGMLAIEIGILTTELGAALPFADADQIITAGVVSP